MKNEFAPLTKTETKEHPGRGHNENDSMNHLVGQLRTGGFVFGGQNGK